ncbi:MarR family transcriptional regulator [Rhodobacterales bacterium HKCCE2091]|nr:MarR family transcriptional regulator [Rhodobacterales bacterium HKCCE2091]
MTREIDSETLGRLRIGTGEVVEIGWLSRDLPFLSRTIRFLLRGESNVMRHELGLEPGEIGVLAVIAHNPGISQNALATAVVLKKSAVTKVVQLLERRGLIERRRSTTDRRSNELCLTRAGEEMTERMHRMSADLHADWFADIPAAERDMFFSVLFRLVAGLAERGPGVPGSGDDD